jgi:hypothetical protein
MTLDPIKREALDQALRAGTGKSWTAEETIEKARAFEAYLRNEQAPVIPQSQADDFKAISGKAGISTVTWVEHSDSLDAIAEAEAQRLRNDLMTNKPTDNVSRGTYNVNPADSWHQIDRAHAAILKEPMP